MRACLRRNQPGPYQIQAAINAVHADAATFDATDWSQVLALYDHLLSMTPTPVVAMNRAIAMGEVRGPQAALEVLDDLDLDEYHLYHAARADLLRRLGRQEDASQAYARAAALTASDAEHAFLSGSSRGDTGGRLTDCLHTPATEVGRDQEVAHGWSGPGDDGRRGRGDRAAETAPRADAR